MHLSAPPYSYRTDAKCWPLFLLREPVGQAHTRLTYLVPLTDALALQRQHTFRLHLFCNLTHLSVVLLVKRCALRRDIQAQILILACTFIIDVKVQALVPILELFLTESYRLLCIDLLLWSCHNNVCFVSLFYFYFFCYHLIYSDLKLHPKLYCFIKRRNKQETEKRKTSLFYCYLAKEKKILKFYYILIVSYFAFCPKPQ